MPFTQLTPHCTVGADVTAQENGTQRMTVLSGDHSEYRVAQLDDYHQFPRSRFPWHPPLTLSLQARASRSEIPGTWGFGFWNNPFGVKLGFGGNHLLPALPNAAWFFFASPENHLSFDNNLPGSGNLAATFCSSRIPFWIFTPGIITLPLMLIPPAARLMRKLTSQFVPQDTKCLTLDPTVWHRYRLDWMRKQVDFYINDHPVFSTKVSPRGPLGLVIWLDNQFAAWCPNGRLKYGTLPSDSNWIEIRDLVIQPGSPE